MSYLPNAAQVVKYLLPALDFNLVSFVDRKGVATIDRWESVLIQPTEEEVSKAAASPEYATWLAENGGDPTRTLRKQAEDSLSDNQKSNMLLRSVILILVDEFNRHSDRTNAILDAIDGANSLSSLKSAIGTIPNIPTRTGGQLRKAAISKIKAGDSDN